MPTGIGLDRRSAAQSRLAGAGCIAAEEPEDRQDARPVRQDATLDRAGCALHGRLSSRARSKEGPEAGHSAPDVIGDFRPLTRTRTHQRPKAFAFRWFLAIPWIACFRPARRLGASNDLANLHTPRRSLTSTNPGTPPGIAAMRRSCGFPTTPAGELA